MPHLGQSGWRDPGAYAALAEIDRSGFAWEWLRRSADFQRAAFGALAKRGCGLQPNFRGADDKEERETLFWGLHAFEDPELPAPLARPVWAATRHSWVVSARADVCELSEDCFRLEALAPFVKLVSSADAEHLLLSDGYRAIRLDVSGARLGDGPVQLSFLLEGIHKLDRPLSVLERLRSLNLRQRFAAPLYPPLKRARRLILLLRTIDALESGASQAEIAQVLLRAHLDRSRWRVHSPSLRSQAQRLVRKARAMAQGEFWKLLA